MDISDAYTKVVFMLVAFRWCPVLKTFRDDYVQKCCAKVGHCIIHLEEKQRCWCNRSSSVLQNLWRAGTPGRSLHWLKMLRFKNEKWKNGTCGGREKVNGCFLVINAASLLLFYLQLSSQSISSTPIFGFLSQLQDFISVFDLFMTTGN